MSKTSATRAAANVAGQQTLNSQPSEEDLFYMLIHKMKRRDETEVAETALKEQMNEKLCKADEENKTLAAQLKQATARSNKQETELTSQRTIVEKWKLKFGKLRDLVRSIGDDHESLRDEGRRMSAVQDSLNEHKTQIFDQLNVVNKTAETMREKSSQQKHRISDIQQDTRALEQSVALTEAKAQDKERELAREKARVTTLEGYIKSSSNKHIKQTQVVQQTQLDAISKIDGMYKHIDTCVKDSQSALKTEVGNILNSSTEILTAVNERRSIDPAQLETINTSIMELYLK